MEIKYTTLSGQEFEVSNDFRCFGMNVLWNAFMQAKEGTKQAQLLNEAHSIMSGVLYGKITKEEDNPPSSFPNEHYKIWDEKEKTYVTDKLSNNGLFPAAEGAIEHADKLDIQFQIHKFKDNKFIQALP